jgi:hypothetical protein
MEVFMRKSVSRTLYLLAVVCAIGAAVLVFLGLNGTTITTLPSNASYTDVINTVNNPALVIAGAAVAVIGSILALIAWVGALIRTAQLGRWGWFVCLLVLSGITMLVYIFAGPTTPANQPAYAGQYPPEQYPRQ